MEGAFKTEVHRYQVRGEGHFALSRAPSVPADLGTFVLGLHGVTDLRPAPPRPRRGTPAPDFTFRGSPALAPVDYAVIYDIAPLYAANITGAGQTIAIVGESAYNHPDVLYFRQQFPPLDTSNVPTDMLIPGTGNSVVEGQGDVEEAEASTLEWSGAIARDATVLYVYTGNGDSGGSFDAMYYAVEQRLAPIVSVSYDSCEMGLAPSDAVYYGTLGDLAAMTGVTVLVGSGDTGAAACDLGLQEGAATYGELVSFPASIPSITAVGGTQFNFTASNQSTYWDSSGNAKSYIPEEAWNETFSAGAGGLAATGGGYSVMFARPYWQASALPTSSFRGVPDVSLTAAAGIAPYVIGFSWTSADGPGTLVPEGLTAIGGTSASTPSFAGLLALLNQAIDAPVPGLGNINPTLYALYYANAPSVPSAFHDITQGSNMVPCQTGTPSCPTTGTPEFGYSAGPGYDLVTGLGSVDAAKLVTAWTTLAPTSTKLSVTGAASGDAGTPEGTPLQFTASVGSAATSPAVTGTVTFYFKTVNAAGSPDIGYVLGEVPVTGDVADGGTEGATATLNAAAPVGLDGRRRGCGLLRRRPALPRFLLHRVQPEPRRRPSPSHLRRSPCSPTSRPPSRPPPSRRP